jgi:RNA polymerase sigma-70 factor, ECF subfamily
MEFNGLRGFSLHKKTDGPLFPVFLVPNSRRSPFYIVEDAFSSFSHLLARKAKLMAIPGSDHTEEFLRLLGQHDRMLYAYVLALTHRWSDADDVMQETRIRLWQQFDKYEPGTDFAAWARSVAYYLVLAQREKTSRSKLQFGTAFCEAVAAECVAAADQMPLRQEALLRCMEKLDAAKRSLLESYCIGEQSLRDLAREMGRSYESVRKTVYRAQVALAECIEREMRKEAER